MLYFFTDHFKVCLYDHFIDTIELKKGEERVGKGGGKKEEKRWRESASPLDVMGKTD